MMWSSSEEEDEDGAWSPHEQRVFRELLAECRHCAPAARLPARLRDALETMRPERRRSFVSRTRRGNAPLFLVSQRGNAESAEYLLRVCGADPEQRGVFRPGDLSAPHRVTPLWCAAVGGRTRVLRVLCEAGADVDARSDSGSTPARSACYLARAEALRELADRGADLRAPNHAGGTCLMNAVHAPRLAAFLLRRAVPPDARDAAGRTALHHAVRERREDTARLLLDAGADPRACDRRGDDPLRLAALAGCSASVALLSRRASRTTAECAEAYALLGATLVSDRNDAEGADRCWRRAIRLSASALRADALAARAPCLREVALSVFERALGPTHPEVWSRLVSAGVALAEEGRFRAALALWVRALDWRAAQQSLLHAEAEETLRMCTRLLSDAGWRGVRRAREAGGAFPAFADAFSVWEVVARRLPEAVWLAECRPRCRAQASRLSAALHCACVVLHVACGSRGGAGRVRAGLRALEAGVRARMVRVCAEGGRWARAPPCRLLAAGAVVLPSARALRELLRAGTRPPARTARAAVLLRAPPAVRALLPPPCCPRRGAAPPPLRCLCARTLLRAPLAPLLRPDALPPSLRDFLMEH